MDDVLDSKLTIKNENGENVVINVFDIVDSDEFDKTFIIYSLENDSNTLYASVLKEDDLSFSLNTIMEEKEINYVEELIKYFTEDDIEEESV
ncbi:MAG: hypothetical protein IJ399_02000 [Bacilli bacterium]|nr:hypothetical protein [Bacilli bacterium]